MPMFFRADPLDKKSETPMTLPSEPPLDRRSELKAFLFLTIVMAPVIAGVVIGAYGLAVWIYQMFAGPPTG